MYFDLYLSNNPTQSTYKYFNSFLFDHNRSLAITIVESDFRPWNRNQRTVTFTEQRWMSFYTLEELLRGRNWKTRREEAGSYHPLKLELPITSLFVQSCP